MWRWWFYRPENWIPINDLPDVKIKTVKINFSNFFDRKIVNEKFDKLHIKRRTEFTTQPTLYKYPIFVVCKTVKTERKKKCNSKYPWFQQNNGHKFLFYTITIKDHFRNNWLSIYIGFRRNQFFYHWLVRVIDRHRFTVVSHRGQKQFNIAVMGFKNFPFYV